MDIDCYTTLCLTRVEYGIQICVGKLFPPSRRKKRVNITAIYQLSLKELTVLSPSFIAITTSKHSLTKKIILLTFQCLHNMAPSYLQKLLKKYTPARNLGPS